MTEFAGSLGERAVGTPQRRPGSVRRTTTHDSLRPDGANGPVTLVARGRDLITRADSSAEVIDEASVEASVEFPARVITALRTQPDDPRTAALTGLRAASGFRGAVLDAVADRRGGVLFQLLDDLPTALLVSGVAMLDLGAVSPKQALANAAAPAQPPPRDIGVNVRTDLCAGWVAGGTLMQQLEQMGDALPRRRPEAPALVTDDPLAWHATDPLPAHGMRRRRRLDAWFEQNLVEVETFFRDSHMDAEGRETIVHEYTVQATYDPATGRFVGAHADFGALPWPECPGALLSARRIVGQEPEGLRTYVRDEFVGPSTCTHLNDTIRSLEDLPKLLAPLR